MDRYLLREYLLLVGYCFATCVMIQVLSDLFNYLARLLKAGVSPLHALLYYLCRLGPNLEYLLPVSLLLATLYTLWQLTRHNELVAMRVSGVRLMRIMMPFLAVGFTVSIFSMVMKEYVTPKAELWSALFAASNYDGDNLSAAKGRLDYVNSQEHRQWVIDGFDVRNPRVLKGVVIQQEREDGSVVKKVVADRAEWLDGEWWFFEAKEQDYNEEGNAIGSAHGLTGSGRGIPMNHLTETPMDFAVKAKLAVASHLDAAEILTSQELVLHIKSLSGAARNRIIKEKVDFHCRFATPWACLVVALFGIPVGAKTGRQSALAGVLAAILCFFSFYALTHVGIFLGKREVLWPWLAAWLSNIVFIVAGIRMLLTMK